MKFKKVFWRWIAVIIIVCLFIYMVLLNYTLRVPVTREWMEQYRGRMEICYEDPEYLVKETSVAILHQYPLLTGGPIHNRYVWVSLIVTVSAFLWSSLFCFLIAPNGFLFKDGTIVQHMIFSAVLATVSLFQILKSLRYEPKYFIWIPWFLIVLCFLVFRSYRRITRGYRTIKEEIFFHLPWIIGLIVPHIVWFEPFRSMNQGTPIELPLSGYSVNSYTILMNTILFIVALGFIPGVRREIRKEYTP